MVFNGIQKNQWNKLNSMEYNEIQQNTLKFNEIKWNTMTYSATQWNTMKYNGINKTQ